MTDEHLRPAEDLETEPGGPEEGEPERNWAEEARKFQDLYLRCEAETKNMRRRFQNEREEQLRFAAEKVIKSLLPVLDNLGLALSYVKEDASADVQSLAEGVRMTMKGFNDALAENGVKPVPAERGSAFDPNLHDALGQSPESDLPPGSVSQEIQKGYTLYGRLLRPAKVLVAVAA